MGPFFPSDVHSGPSGWQVILRHQKEGFPSTAIREIRALRALHNHPNVAWAGCTNMAFDGVDAYGTHMYLCMTCVRHGDGSELSKPMRSCFGGAEHHFFSAISISRPWFGRANAMHLIVRHGG